MRFATFAQGKPAEEAGCFRQSFGMPILWTSEFVVLLKLVLRRSMTSKVNFLVLVIFFCVLSLTFMFFVVGRFASPKKQNAFFTSNLKLHNLKQQGICIGRNKTFCEVGFQTQVEDIDLDKLDGKDTFHSGGKTGCKEAYVTILTSDYYLPGTLVFIHSIRTYMEDDRDLVVLITSNVSTIAVEALQSACVVIKRVESLGNPNPSSWYQPRFHDAYTKTAVWAIDEYEKMVYGDSDQFAVRSYDPLFDFPSFSAQERTYQDHRYTSSLMVFEPSRVTFNDMKAKFTTLKSDDGADMGFISSYFPQSDNRTIPYYFAIWRRTLVINSSMWDWEKIHGVDCTGLVEEKPWAENWHTKNQKEYVELYKIWWKNYYDMLGITPPATIQEYKTILPEQYPQYLKRH